MTSSTPAQLMQWHFAKAGSPQRQRNSTLDEHFAGSGSNRAGDLVREGGQNSADAKLTDPVRVRISFGELAANRAAVYAVGLAEHAVDCAEQSKVESLRAVNPDAPCKYLTFEDFNTTGLTGQTEIERRYRTDPPNAFHTFFRAEGQTDKLEGTKQGSKGIGKVTFLAVSRARAVLGLTRRADGRSLLFGTSVLLTHRHAGADYDGDAWFGRIAPGSSRVDPIEDESILAQFCEDFCLSRKTDETGFSLVVPWLDDDPEDGVTAERVIDAILRDHALPILQGKLTFEVVDPDERKTVIDAPHFLAVLDARPDAKLKAQVRPMAELATWALAHPPIAPSDQLGIHKETAPAWSDDGLLAPEQRERLRDALDAGEPIALRVPVRIRRQARGAAEEISEFDVFLRKDPPGSLASAAAAVAGRGGTVQFVRGGVLISAMGRQLAGYRGLVVATHPALAGFLRAAENPSHTKWSAKPQEVKDVYKYAPGTLSFVVDAPRELTRLLAGDPAERDARVWADLLGLPAGDLMLPGAGGKGARKQKRPKKAGAGDGTSGTDTGNKTVTPPVKKRPYDVIVNPAAGGFTVRPSGLPFTTALPARVELRFAYYIRGKDPFAKWTPKDFDMTRASAFPSMARNCEVQIREPNRLVLRLTDSDFEFTMSGFDTRREPDCKHRQLKPAGMVDTGEAREDATPDEDADDQPAAATTSNTGGAA